MANISAAAFGCLVALVLIALIAVSLLLHRSVAAIERDTRSYHLASAVRLELLTYQRLRNLRVLTGEERLDRETAAMIATIEDLVAQAEAYVGSAGEQARLAAVSRQIERYVDERRRLEEAGLGAEAIIRDSQPSLYAAVNDLDEFRELNDAQTAEANARAGRLADLASLVGVGAGVVFVGGLLLIILGVHRYLLRPLLELHQAISGFRVGQMDTRVKAGGFSEVWELAQGYNDMADALQRQREDQLTFLAGVAHDLRNPLSGLKLGLQTLEQDQSETARNRARSRFDRQIDRLARMVDDLLDATRIEAGRLELHIEELDLRDVVADMVALYAPTSPNHEIKAELPATPVVAWADPLRIEQVVSNLLSNAIKFSPQGRLIQVTVGEADDDVVLTVTDHGIGIRKEELADIFVPFRRRRPEIAPGAGLGLSVVQRIVTAHGGRIEVESEPGMGTTFRIRIPRAPASVGGSSQSEVVLQSGTALARILIVDDELDISEILAQILTARGYQVRTAADGQEGLRCLREEQPDVVILDVEMPHLTGPDMAYRMIVENSGMQYIPIVLVSGVVGLADVAARVGTPYSLGKPAALPKLLALVERALVEKTAPSPPAGLVGDHERVP